jgi:hypothetical protein
MEQGLVNGLLIFDTAVRRIGDDLNCTTASGVLSSFKSPIGYLSLALLV